MTESIRRERGGVRSWELLLRPLSIGAAAFAFVVAACGPIPVQMSSAERTAVAVCEQVAKTRIASPASYKLIWSNFKETPALTAEETRGYKSASSGAASSGSGEVDRGIAAVADAMERTRLRKIERGEKLDFAETQITNAIKEQNAAAARNAPSDRSGAVVLEYDAQNTFGAVIRSFHSCRLDAVGTDMVFEESDVLYDTELSRTEGEEIKRTRYQNIDRK